MARTKYDNEFKVMIVELLNSGIKTEQVGNDYGLNISMISRWKREYYLLKSKNLKL
jgi:transposase